jgi:hypothetical protein
LHDILPDGFLTYLALEHELGGEKLFLETAAEAGGAVCEGEGRFNGRLEGGQGGGEMGDERGEMGLEGG